ncbi:competence protein CoiA family protein [Bacillaceae bacterium S4-13-58]
MLQAFSQSHRLLNTAAYPRDELLKKKHESYFCPECKEEVILKVGHKNIPHFAHKKTSTCILHQGESKYHEQGKYQLYQWLQKNKIPTELEVYFPETRQRADIIFNFKQRKWALEYQCSSLPMSVWKQRTQSYRELGILPFWILGGNRLKMVKEGVLRLDELDYHAIHLNQARQPQLIYYCSSSQRFAQFSHLYPSSASEVHGFLSYIKLENAQFTQLFKQETFPYSMLLNNWQKQKENRRLIPINENNKEIRNWKKFLYAHGISPLLIPSSIDLPVPHQWRIKIPPFLWQTYLYVSLIMMKSPGTLITLSMAKAILRSFFPMEEKILYSITNHDPFHSYLEGLCYLNILSPVQEECYMIQKIEAPPRGIEEALHRDQEFLALLLEKWQ